jgi:UDP-N-acetyl-D-mannosaminuronate dehydrogenase
MSHGRKIAVIGLGYVGLPVAAAFARAGSPLTCDRAGLRFADFFIVTVPTPIDAANRLDLSAMFEASRMVGTALKKGDIVVYESTVYPGAIEEDCVPILERASGLKAGTDFDVGYSPERMNPGDKKHRFETDTKVVSAQNARILAGRRINDEMEREIARECIRGLLRRKGRAGVVTVLGMTFKENVPGIHNSRVIDVVRELKSFGVKVQIADPLADPHAVEDGIALSDIDALEPADTLIWPSRMMSMSRAAGAWYSVCFMRAQVSSEKMKLDRSAKPSGVELWRL